MQAGQHLWTFAASGRLQSPWLILGNCRRSALSSTDSCIALMLLSGAETVGLTYEDVVNIPAGYMVHPVPEEVKIGAAGPGDNDCIVLAAALDQLRC